MSAYICTYIPKSVGGIILETIVRHIGPPTALKAPAAIAMYKCQASVATPCTTLRIVSLMKAIKPKVTTDNLKPYNIHTYIYSE